MSIPRENVPGVLWVDRQIVTEALVHTLRIAQLLAETDQLPERLSEPLGDILSALPDEDIAELHYAVMEMGVAETAILLGRKVRAVHSLRDQIETAMEGLHEEF